MLYFFLSPLVLLHFRNKRQVGTRCPGVAGWPSPVARCWFWNVAVCWWSVFTCWHRTKITAIHIVFTHQPVLFNAQWVAVNAGIKEVVYVIKKNATYFICFRLSMSGKDQTSSSTTVSPFLSTRTAPFLSLRSLFLPALLPSSSTSILLPHAERMRSSFPLESTDF